MAVFAAGLFCSCDAQSTNSSKNSETVAQEEVRAYYFHYTRRCPTCIAVEDEAKKAVEELYGEDSSFESYNLDEDKGKKMAEKLDVESQALLIMKGEKKKDLTSDGFMYAKTKPEKLKEQIKKAVDDM